MSGSRGKPRAIVDTNLFVSAMLFRRGNPYALLTAWRTNAFELLLSDDQYAELADVFSRPQIVQRYRVPANDLDVLFAGFARATRVRPSSPVPVVVRDPDDVPILAAALGGEADYLVTGDAGLLDLRHDAKLGNLRIVTVAEFFAILDQLALPPGADR